MMHVNMNLPPCKRPPALLRASKTRTTRLTPTMIISSTSMITPMPYSITHRVTFMTMSTVVASR